MPTSLPQSMAGFLPDENPRLFTQLSLILSLTGALLLPPIALLLIAATVVGHGQISFEAIGIVLQNAGAADPCLVADAC